MTDQPLAPDSEKNPPESSQSSPDTAPVPVPPMPVAVPPQGPFKRGFGLGAGAGAGLAVVALIFGTVLTLLTSLGLLAAGAFAQAGSGAASTVTVWGPASASGTLRAIDINGTILTDADGGTVLSGGTYGYEVASMIDDLTAADADGLVLRVNTPGGTVTGSRAIADAITRYQERTGNKVFAHVQGLAASGGMYAMAPADDIQADYGSLVGSIGVIYGPFTRYRDVVAVDGGSLVGGVTTTGGVDQFSFTQGAGKDAGDPFRDLTPEERAIFQRNVDNEYAAFVEFVSTHRGIPETTIRTELGAYIFDNEVAEERNLIDGTMGVDQAYRHFATLAGLDPASTKVVAPAVPGFLSSVLGVEQRLPGQALPAADGEAALVTARAICGSAPMILAYHGDPQSNCG